jgi:hypothetical protein
MHRPTLASNNAGLFRVFWRAVLTSLAVATLSLPVASQAAKRASLHGIAQVYLLKGFANFSPGFDALAAQIRKHGLSVEVHNHLMGDSLIPQIKQNYRRGQRRIILVGHSFGAGEVVSMANDLGRAGIPVILLVTLDPVVHLQMPGNVRRQINLYVSDGMGHAVARGHNAHGHLVNRDYKGQPDIGHLSITTAPRVRRLIVNAVLSAAGSVHGNGAIGSDLLGARLQATLPQSRSAGTAAADLRSGTGRDS